MELIHDVIIKKQTEGSTFNGTYSLHSIKNVAFRVCLFIPILLFNCKMYLDAVFTIIESIFFSGRLKYFVAIIKRDSMINANEIARNR